MASLLSYSSLPALASCFPDFSLLTLPSPAFASCLTDYYLFALLSCLPDSSLSVLIGLALKTGSNGLNLGIKVIWGAKRPLLLLRPSVSSYVHLSMYICPIWQWARFSEHLAFVVDKANETINCIIEIQGISITYLFPHIFTHIIPNIKCIPNLHHASASAGLQKLLKQKRVLNDCI